MAMGLKEEMGKMEIPDDSGYLSDESEFYGDEATKEYLESQVGAFSVADWWEQKKEKPSLTETADAGIGTKEAGKSATLYNPYEGCFSGRQLAETVDEFLERLPPQTTSQSENVPWIFIANPYRKVPGPKSEKVELEGPPDEESDWAEFVRRGGDLLEELTGLRHDLEKEMMGKAKGTVTKAWNALGYKDRIVQELLDTAVKLHCSSGKWMMFCDPSEINEVWKVVAHTTAKNELGTTAKVAPDNGDPARPHRLICIYTKDFKDMEDVSRVARKMRDIGLIDSRGRGIYYKCDAYTYLGLTSDNKWGIKASLYGSNDVLAAQGDKKKLEGLFKKKKKNETADWLEAEG